MSEAHRTGIEGYYSVVDGRRLRFGYTTGTCAAAAAKAAAAALLSGSFARSVVIMTPKGIELDLEVESAELANGVASCGVRKFSGDDPDITDGALIVATVSTRKDSEIVIDGGVGVGRVTKPGLQRNIGEAAINDGPRAMISSELRAMLAADGRGVGLDVVISVPEGEALSKKTFNPILGIEGGISILGTSGIVEPMSEAAFVDSMKIEIAQRRALGESRIVIVPGNYGADFLRAFVGRDVECVKCGNSVGAAIDCANDEGFSEILFVSHIGKMIKISGGIMNTHSRDADARAEIFAACAIRAGADAATARAILDCVATDEMLRVADRAGVMAQTVREACDAAQMHLARRAKAATVSTILFTGATTFLASSGEAERWINELKDIS